MNRTRYYAYIDERLHTLAQRIITAGKLNVLDLHMHSEGFYLHLLNLLYGYTLENLNKSLQNVEAIDLIDHTNKIVIQVSAKNTKYKIEEALKKDIIRKYSHYKFKFISIAKDASNLKKSNFQNPHSITFNPPIDIYDITAILNEILSATIDKQKNIYQFIKKELGNEVDIVKLDSNLATIINILATEQWDDANNPGSINDFEIERKIVYNDLNSAKYIIKEYCIYYGRINAKYSEFDSLGKNKSNSVLATIRREYLKIRNNNKDADTIFFSVVDKTIEKVLNSANYVQVPIDELELCADILVVDAFIRCKIFQNPKDYNYVTS